MIVTFLAIISLLVSGLLMSQDSISDFDGNYYPTVVIGEQTWMAENLKSTHAASGRRINRICYGNFEHNCEHYGGLYSWNVAISGRKDSIKQGICPNGWHIPDDSEWQELIDAIGGADSASYKLKLGIVPGFNIQYAGNYHTRLKNFNFQDDNAYYWTASSFSKTAAWIWMFGEKHLNANRSTVPNIYGLSVRCLKNK